MSVEITSIPPEVVHTFWYELHEFIDSALKHSLGEVTTVQLLEMILAKKAQLWGIREGEEFVGACVTEVIQYPNARSLRITTLGGKKMASWTEQLGGVMDEYASTVTADRIEAVGRRGFTRRLAPLGFKPAYTIMVKEMNSANGKGDNHE